jgi:hypothetical protein
MRHVLTLLVMSILGMLHRMQVRITPSRPQNSPLGQQSPLVHPVHGMMLRKVAGSMSLFQDLGSKACLLLPHKINPKSSPNPLRDYKIRLISKTSAISLRARRWSQRLTPCPSLPTTAMMDGRTWVSRAVQRAFCSRTTPTPDSPRDLETRGASFRLNIEVVRPGSFKASQKHLDEKSGTELYRKFIPTIQVGLATSLPPFFQVTKTLVNRHTTWASALCGVLFAASNPNHP